MEFTFAITATRLVGSNTIKSKITIGSIRNAHSGNEAVEAARKDCFDCYPIEDGWQGHLYVIHNMEDWVREQEELIIELTKALMGEIDFIGGATKASAYALAKVHKLFPETVATMAEEFSLPKSLQFPEEEKSEETKDRTTNV